MQSGERLRFILLSEDEARAPTIALKKIYGAGDVSFSLSWAISVAEKT